MSLYGEGSHISYKGKAIWREGIDGSGAESYDTTVITMSKRLAEMGVQVGK
jgi:hypothetical protein